MKKIVILASLFFIFGMAIFFISESSIKTKMLSEIKTNNISLNTDKEVDTSKNFAKNSNAKNIYTQGGSFFLFSPSDSDENKIKIIESFYDSEKMRGKTNEITQLLLQEKDSFVIKSLSKLLMQSLSDNVDVPSILLKLLSVEGDVSYYIRDYLPEYVSTNEMKEIYKNGASLSEETKISLLRYYTNNSLVNGINPDDDLYMSNESEKYKNDLNINYQKILVLSIYTGLENVDYISSMRNNSFVKEHLREIPSKLDNSDIVMWFVANIAISSDEKEKADFIKMASNILNNEQKTIINDDYMKVF